LAADEGRLGLAPPTFSLEEFQRLPSRSQITHPACEEGRSFFAQGSGVPLSEVLSQAGVSEQAKYLAVFALDDSWESLDLPDGYPPQTYLVHYLNGNDLSAEDGAALRLRVAPQLRSKYVKFLSPTPVTDRMKSIRNGKESISPDSGCSWHAGIEGLPQIPILLAKPFLTLRFALSWLLLTSVNLGCT
jgi:DMSO/TMAO reductase YedYZ molybdopterin-dependent catalytic subunit